jgi:glutathione S-transferase
MILVGQYDSPYVRRCAIALHLLDLPFARDTRSVFADADTMRTINPVGRIPSLILDDGEVVIDSGAILDHLDHQVGPARALLPPAGRDRRTALFMTMLASGTTDKMGAVVYERTLRPADKQHPPWLERCTTQVESGLAGLEERLDPAGGWVVGDRPMQPDITIGCMLYYLRDRARDLFPAGRYPRLARFAARCDALPAFVATAPSADEAMPGVLQ